MANRVTPRRKDVALAAKTFKGKSGNDYLVFKTPDGGFQIFVETEATAAALDWGGAGRTPRDKWQSIWDQQTT